MAPAPIRTDPLLRNHHQVTVYDAYRINGATWAYSSAPCGWTVAEVGGCEAPGNIVYISDTTPAYYLPFALWHELHHIIDDQRGVSYDETRECAADAFAFAHDKSANPAWGYQCVNGHVPSDRLISQP